MAMQDLDKVLGNGYEAKVPDLDWASMDVASYDNIPTENKVETIPQLVEQWSNRPERGTRLVGLVEAPIKKSASEVSKESIDEVVTCAKKEMMKGLRGKELAEKLASIFPPWTIKAAKDSLKSVADEQGLLGSVYVDLSVFDSCREASEVLGANRIRLADYVVGNPRKHVCSSHHDGYCKELKKTAVSEVPYGPEMYDKYTKHLRVAGILSSSECVTDKETLRGALLKTPETRHQTSIEVPAKDKSAKLKGTETLEQALEKAASDREASSSKYATSRPIMAYMQDQMLRGITGDELKKSVGSRFSMDVVRSFSGDMRRLASLQGLVGNVYVDVGYYKNAEDAVQAISSAKTRPSYIVNTSPEAEYDGRIAAVAKATGCAPLPPDGAIDNKVAQGYIDDLRFSGRLSSEKADSYSKLLVAGRKPLAVLREAFLCTERSDKSLKSAAQMGTWYGGKSTNKVENRTAVTEAAKKALDSGVSTDRVQAKLASIVPTAEATGMVHKLLSNMTEVGASCLPHCSSENYLLAKGATIKMASKCKNCVNSTGSACLKQGAKFAGAVDYDKAFIDMTMLTAAEKDKKLAVLAVYDNGGETADRYTVVYNQKDSGKYECLGMSEHPSHPQGFGQHSTCQLGSHLGKKIKFTDLPADCQKAVNQDLNEPTSKEAAEKDKKEDKKSDKGGNKATKYDPKDGVEPVVQKVLPKENPDVERSDMKQPYDMTDEFGSGSNKAMDKLREMDEKEPAESKDKGKDKKKDK